MKGKRYLVNVDLAESIVHLNPELYTLDSKCITGIKQSAGKGFVYVDEKELDAYLSNKETLLFNNKTVKNLRMCDLCLARMSKEPKRQKGTWSAFRVASIIGISVGYGSWFNLLDSILYCASLDGGKICSSMGEIFGGNLLYQSWNIIGHFIPTLPAFLFRPFKLEIPVAAFLISTAIMDSPLWGVVRLLRGAPLWHADVQGNEIPTFNLSDWILYYYNPIGSYLVWDSPWLFPGFPNAAAIFWSLAGRIAAAALLIWWQNRQERKGKEFSLKHLFRSKKDVRLRGP